MIAQIVVFFRAKLMRKEIKMLRFLRKNCTRAKCYLGLDVTLHRVISQDKYVLLLITVN